MAKLLWGKVFFQDTFAGFLRQEPGEAYTFTYDESYIESKNPPIAYSLPLRKAPHISANALHPFFDNLVAEGWLEKAQTRLLGKRYASRFELLLAFGKDCAGAVSIIDPELPQLTIDRIDNTDHTTLALYRNRASLSGIQPKLVLVKENNKYKVASINEVSTHIAKFPSSTISDILYSELITTRGCQALLPDDTFVELELQNIEDIPEEALVIKRFDRTDGNKKIHFEEFNQLLGLPSIAKYDGSYADMANFIDTSPDCLPIENYRLYKRIIAGLLTGNTDMHFKNFSMLHTSNGLRLSPNYDQVAAAIYKEYQTVALELDKEKDRIIGQLKSKNIVALGKEFFLDNDSIFMAIQEIEKQLDTAKTAIEAACDGHASIKTRVIQFMEKRWNGTFSSTGQLLSKKQ